LLVELEPIRVEEEIVGCRLLIVALKVVGNTRDGNRLGAAEGSADGEDEGSEDGAVEGNGDGEDEGVICGGDIVGGGGGGGNEEGDVVG
jgi:hypothetical protein